MFRPRAELTVRRRIYGDGIVTNCSAEPCEIRVLYTEIPAAPIEIDGTTPLVRPSLTISPPDSFADNELVELRGEGFSPYESYAPRNLIAQPPPHESWPRVG